MDLVMNETFFLLRGYPEAELQVHCRFSELMLQSREIEEQTRVDFRGKPALLWEAIQQLTEECFTRWHELADARRESFVRQALAIKERSAGEGEALVLAALNNPLHPKAIARTMLLGNNFLRSLDICLEALLRYPSQKSLTRKPLKTQVVIDWAVGGLRDWACNFPYSFESAAAGKAPAQRLTHVSRHYSTDRSVRSQISHKQIANIFLLRDASVADLERRGLAQLRAQWEAEGGERSE
jgi:hypothetical protein